MLRTCNANHRDTPFLAIKTNSQRGELYNPFVDKMLLEVVMNHHLLFV